MNIAGTHHETIDSHGYPRGLSSDELSVRARIMAIADIFELFLRSGVYLDFAYCYLSPRAD